MPYDSIDALYQRSRFAFLQVVAGIAKFAYEYAPSDKSATVRLQVFAAILHTATDDSLPPDAKKTELERAIRSVHYFDYCSNCARDEMLAYADALVESYAARWKEERK